MTQSESSPILFKKIDPDAYRLTSSEPNTLEAAWLVLRAFEINRHGRNRDYIDEYKDCTLEYLHSSGEERPLGGVFGVAISESIETDGAFDLFVDNRNGRGNEGYREMLRHAIEVVGVVDVSIVDSH